MGAHGASVNGATAITEAQPEAIAVDQNPALIEDPLQEQRRPCVDPLQMRDINPAPSNRLQAGGQLEGIRRAIAAQRDHQVEVRPSVLVATCNRAVQHSQPYPALGAKRPSKPGKQLPVTLQILALAYLKPKPPWPGATAAQCPL